MVLNGEKTLTAIIAICKAASTVKGIRVQLSFRYYGFVPAACGETSICPIVINFYDSEHDNIKKLRHLNRMEATGGTPEGICFEALQRKVMLPLLGKGNMFINFSDGEPNGSEAINITTNVIKKFRSIGILVLSYFICEGEPDERAETTFRSMYGKDAEFIDVNSMIRLASTINKQILKMS